MNKTRYALLGLLAERPCSGYELKQVVETRFALFWKESYGQIYPELKRMEGESLVTSTTEGPRGRTCYTMTDRGRQALTTWVAGEPDEDQVRSELLLKLYFSAFAPESVRQQHLATLMDRARNQVAWLENSEQQLLSLIEDDATHPRALAVVRLGLATRRAQLSWAEEELNRSQKSKEGIDT